MALRRPSRLTFQMILVVPYEVPSAAVPAGDRLPDRVITLGSVLAACDQGGGRPRSAVPVAGSERAAGGRWAEVLAVVAGVPEVGEEQAAAWAQHAHRFVDGPLASF